MLKRILLAFVFLCALCGSAFPQNLTTVTASNITDINGSKLTAGQLCFLITDQQDNPISVSIGGGGQALKRGYCSPIAAGVVTTFTVPNPASTLPSGIYYRVTVKDSSTGQEVLRYTQVSFTGAAFNFDNYAPLNLGTPAPLSGNSVTGNLSVTGNVAATGTVTGSNIAGGSIVTGAGTTNAIPRYTSGASAIIGNSSISDNGTTLTASEPLVFNGASTNSGAALTVGGTTSTTGGMSVFVGPPGSQGEIAAVYPADGVAAALRTQGLSVRSTIGGFLTGTAGATISNVGAITGTSLNLAGTGVLSTTAQSGTGSHCMTTSCVMTTPSIASATLTTPAIGSAGATFAGSTSGTITLKAAAVATGTVTIPAINDQLVTRTSTDTLTNKTLTSSVLTSPTINTGISQGSGFKHQRFGPPCVPAATAGAICVTNYTWTTAFADASYTAACAGMNPGTGTGTVAINSVTATTVQIIITSTGLANTYSGIDCIAIHD